jgi:hypothetical protein
LRPQRQARCAALPARLRRRWAISFRLSKALESITPMLIKPQSVEKWSADNFMRQTSTRQQLLA